MVELSMYAQIFNWENPYWWKDRNANLEYLRCQQTYFNNLLKIRGKVYLSDVYEGLGFPVDDVSRHVGWRYAEDNVVGDNYIDFGLLEKRFCNDYDIVLDFNVDGII